MKRIIISIILVITVIFNITCILDFFGVVNNPWWVYTIPYLALMLVILIYYDLSKFMTLREYFTYIYVLAVFVLGIISIITYLGNQPIEKGYHHSYSGTIICIDTHDMWGEDDKYSKQCDCK
jgi:predicted tellurium resistance membrane protein TerC